MKLLARYPISFKAHPGRCDNPKTVVCSYPVVCDVPEVSPREVFTVMTVGDKKVIEFDGRLFRLVGNTKSSSVKDFLNEPFLNTNRSLPHQLAGCDGGPSDQFSTAGKPLHNHIYHRLFLDIGDKPRETSLYPDISNDAFHRGAKSRNTCLYEKIENRLHDVDGETFEKGVSEAKSEANKLLIVGNELWTETPPPALSAESEDIYGSRLSIRITFLPDWFDPDLGRQYFPLDAADEAIDCLNSMRTLMGRNAYTDSLPRVVPAFSHEQGGLFNFDHVAYSQQRTALLLGGDLARAIDNSPSKFNAVSAASRAAAETARRLAATCGTEWQDWPDVDDIVCDITEGWLAASRPMGAAYVPDPRHAFGTFICQRAAELSDTRPIALNTHVAGNVPL